MFCTEHCKMFCWKKKRGYIIRGLGNLYFCLHRDSHFHSYKLRSTTMQTLTMFVAHFVHLSTTSGLNSGKIQLTLWSKSLIVSFQSPFWQRRVGNPPFPFLLAFLLCVQWSKFIDNWDPKYASVKIRTKLVWNKKWGHIAMQKMSQFVSKRSKDERVDSNYHLVGGFLAQLNCSQSNLPGKHSCPTGWSQRVK